MNSLKKFTAAMAAIAVSMTSVFTFSVAVAATTFTDASGIASWASASVTSLADAGVLSGRPDGSFDPQGNLNRAEVAKVAVLAAGLTEDTTGAPHFNDVASSDWFYTYVETLYNNGVVGGINGGALDSNGLATYNPAGTLNRAEGSKILVDAFELETSYAGTPPNFPDVASSAWFSDYVETAYAHGILNGYDNGNFGPGDAITREQVAVIAQASIDESADGSKRRSDYTAGAASAVEPTTPVTPVTPVSEGDLNVALSASSPAAQTFPEGASSTPVAAYDFTATTDDVVISSLVITRTGVGADSDWTLYLYDGSDRLTSGKTINSTTHAATFTGLSVTVAAGTTKTLTLKADTPNSTSGSADATGGDSYFEIASAGAVTSNAQSVGGTFPVKSTKQEINNAIEAGTITVEKTGSVTNPKVGEDNVTIAKFKLTSASEAALVQELAFLVDGGITSTDVQNAKLFQSDTELATVASVNSKDLLVFTFDTPYEIAKGDSRNFEIKADLNTGRADDTIKIYVDEQTDVVAIGGTYGFGMTVDLNNPSGYDGSTCTSAAACKGSFTTLVGGDITISSSGPSATDIAINGDDIVMMDFNIASVSEITVKKFEIALTASETVTAGGLLNATANNFTDIKIVNADTGTTIMGPIDATSLQNSEVTSGDTITEATGDNTISYYIFQDEFTMAAGEELNLQLTLDVENNTSLNNDTILATLKITSSYPEVKDINNKTVTNSASIVPSSDITGKTMTVQSPSLTVSQSSTPVSDTYVKGTNDVCFVGFSVAAGDASDAKITEITVTGAISTNADATYNENDGDATCDANACEGATNTYLKDVIGSVELYEGDTKIGTAESVQSDGTATFDSLDYTVAAGATKQIKVCGSLNSSLAAALTPTIKFGVAASGFTVEDEDGNSILTVPSAAINTSITAHETYMTISQGGILTVAVDADTAKEDIVVAGTSDVEISKFKFTTTDEAFLVKKLSINNRQSAVAAATNLGDYDDNVIEVTLSYTNSGGTTETKTGYLTAGTADFSGLDMLIDKDDDAVLTVSATLNTIAAGADAATFVDLDIAFNDFEAVAQGSGETYKGDKIDATVVAAGAYLDFGTISYTDPAGLVLDGAEATVTLGSSLTFDVDEGDDTAPLVFLPVGTVVCFNAGVTEAAADSTTSGVCDTSTDNTAIITGRSTATTEDTYTAVVTNDADGAMATNLAIHYSLPGTGYLANTNQMVVYETKPTVALSASSPSGSRTTAASDSAFIFTIAADAQEKVQFRQESNTKRYAADAVTGEIEFGTTGAFSSALSSTVLVEGSNSIKTTYSADVSADSSAQFTAGSATDLDVATYPKVDVWVRTNVAAGITDTQLQFVCSDAGADVTNVVALGSGTTLVDDTWKLFSNLTNPCDSTDTKVGLAIVAAVTTTTADYVQFDGVRFHAATDANDRIVVDASSDGSLDTTASNVRVLLKEGGSTVAEGGLNMSSASAATVSFFPYGTYTDIDISKGTSKEFTVQLDTTSVVDDQSGTDDPVTFSMALGSSTGGSVTAGGIYWYDTNAQVTWLGQVADTTLNGNTLKY